MIEHIHELTLQGKFYFAFSCFFAVAALIGIAVMTVIAFLLRQISDRLGFRKGLIVSSDFHFGDSVDMRATSQWPIVGDSNDHSDADHSSASAGVDSFPDSG